MFNRPNVIFILADQHNAKVLGHKNHPDVKTPNLDRLRENGIRFDNAIVQNPICTPSRVSWISGQYCHNHGYYGLSGAMPQGLPTVFGHLRRHGYKTAAIGKIHCPEYWVEDDCDLFLETTTCSIGGSSIYEKYLKEHGIDYMEDIAIPEFGDRGIQSCDARPANTPYRHSPEGFSVTKSIEFMASCVKNDDPFFAHISFPKPHQCYLPSKEFWDLYDEKKLTLPPNVDYDMQHKAPHLKKTLEKWKEGSWTLFEPRTYEAGMLRKLHGYLGCISQVDHAVGELINWVESQGIAENTIIIYSSDHGDYACEHGIIEKAPGICSDAITRIPYIWQWKGHFKPNQTCEALVEAVDMVNTVCRLTGIDVLQTSDGKDISPLLMGEKEKIRDYSVTEFAWSKSLRKGKYRLVYYPKEMFAAEYPQGFGELYDLESDPWEMKNLYFETGCQTIVQEMKDDLMEWLVTTFRPRTIMYLADVVAEDGRMHPQMTARYHTAINSDGKIHSDLLRTDLLRKTKYKNYI